MNYYSYDVNYNNCPETFTYYFKAASKAEVAKATGFPVGEIDDVSKTEIKGARQRGRHIDIVHNGRLIETGV